MLAERGRWTIRPKGVGKQEGISECFFYAYYRFYFVADE